MIKQSPFLPVNIEVEYITPQCDIGWNNIINVGLKLLSKYDIKLTQIKEKFGGIRVYFDEVKTLSDSDYDQVSKIIQFMEQLSYKTCEICGTPGTLHVNGNSLLKTVCEEHAKQFNFFDIKNMK